jgi:hypothetical protein
MDVVEEQKVVDNLQHDREKSQAQGPNENPTRHDREERFDLHPGHQIVHDPR